MNENEVFYSVICGRHTSAKDTPQEALDWITDLIQPSTDASITRVTVTDERVIEDPLLDYPGHRRPRKLKPRNYNRGRRKEIKKRRKQKYGGKA